MAWTQVGRVNCSERRARRRQPEHATPCFTEQRDMKTRFTPLAWESWRAWLWVRYMLASAYGTTKGEHECYGVRGGLRAC